MSGETAKRRTFAARKRKRKVLALSLSGAQARGGLVSKFMSSPRRRNMAADDPQVALHLGEIHSTPSPPCQRLGRQKSTGRLIVIVIAVIALLLASATRAESANTHLRRSDQPTTATLATDPLGLEGVNLTARRQPQAAIHRIRRRSAASGSGADLTRVVAVGGQWIELQCPLASELLAIANSGAPKSQPDHAIVWRKDGTPLSHLDPRQKISAQNGSLVLVSSQPTLDEGNYECALVNLARESEPIKSHRFELRLIVAPRLAPFEFPANAQVGMKVMLTCSVLEGQQPISFIWLKDNHIISFDSATGAAATTSSGAASVRGHAHLSPTAAVAANSLGQMHQQQLIDKLSLSAQVSLAGSSLAETINSGRRQEYVLLGGDSSTSGKTSDGTSELLPLLWDSNMRVRQSDDYSILSIERLDLKHAGKYTCSVQNEAARTSHSSQLIINAPPVFTVEPRDGDLVSGQSALIDCAASGHPRPTISWLRARESAAKTWDYVPVYDNLRYTILSNGSLAIANATQREQGFYLCSARNGFGPELTKLIKLSVHEPAKFSSKYKVVEVKIEERASIVCSASGELPTSLQWFDKEGKGIQKSDKRFIIEDEPQDALTGGPENATVSRLMIARTSRSDSGHYTCQASNKFGTDKMVTNLLVQDVPDKVTELKVTNVTASTVSIRWQMAFTGNSPVTSYLVQYQSDDPLDDLLITTASNQQPVHPSTAPELTSNSEQAPTSTVQSSGANPVAASLRAALDALSMVASSGNSVDEAIDRTLAELTIKATSATNWVIKDLSPFCVYRLRLAAINKIGLGEFSDWIRAKTEEAPPSGSALKISTAATGPNSIKITWSPPDRRTWNGQLIGFNIAYRPVDSNFETNKTVEWSAPSLQSLMFDTGNRREQQTTSTSKTITKTSQHDAAAAAVRKAAQELSNQARASVQGAEQQQGNSAQNQTSPARQEKGKLSGGANSYYNLREHLRQLLALQQQELVAHLTNLQRSTTYLVWIQAINNRGVGPQSHAISIRTLDDVPPSAPAIRIQSASPSSITIAWSMLSNFVSSANQYSLFYRKMPPNGSRANTSNSQPFSLAEDNQPAYMEPGPFIERTITSQQLLMGGNVFMGSPDLPDSPPDDATNYLHSSQSQHYQQFVYTLDQLDCGSVYELYMTTRNSVGKSEPSPVVTTRTLGEPPLAPTNRNAMFTRIGTSEVALNFDTWLTGGCPLTHVTVRYKQTPSPVASASGSHPSNQSSWNSTSSSSLMVSWPITTSVPMSILNSINSNQHQHQQQSGSNFSPKIIDESPTSTFSLKNLQPSTSYELEIVAHNSAGHTTAQYEFVTANSNGTRAGYSRREGVYRMDHRGASVQQISDRFNPNQALLDQPAPFTNQSGVSGQLIPVILLLLCLTCLIVISTICYYRLTDSWKRQHRRSSDSDDSNSKSLRCQSSPGSYTGKSSIWRPTTGRSTLKLRGNRLDEDDELRNQDTPSVLNHHTCPRDQASSQHLLAANQSQFSQSVSMRDFNLMSPPLNAGNGVGHHVAGSATLNFKSIRPSSMRPAIDAHRAGTLRARLVSDESVVPFTSNNNLTGTNYNQLAQEPGVGVCTGVIYSTCEQKTAADLYAGQAAAMQRAAIYSNTLAPQHQQATSYSNPNQVVYGQCNYQNNDNLQQETSWTTGNYGVNQTAGVCTGEHGTSYAIPSSSCPVDGSANGLNSEPYPTNTSIEACIQQLIDQQQQLAATDQQQQQQQYAMVVNQRNLTEKNLADHRSAQGPHQTTLSTCGQSAIDSSSSSSGIDVGNHLDCNGSTIGPATSSNVSQRDYMTTKRQQGPMMSNPSASHSRQQNEM